METKDIYTVLNQFNIDEFNALKNFTSDQASMFDGACQDDIDDMTPYAICALLDGYIDDYCKLNIKQKTLDLTVNMYTITFNALIQDQLERAISLDKDFLYGSALDKNFDRIVLNDIAIQIKNLRYAYYKSCTMFN